MKHTHTPHGVSQIWARPTVRRIKLVIACKIFQRDTLYFKGKKFLQHPPFQLLTSLRKDKNKKRKWYPLLMHPSQSQSVENQTSTCHKEKLKL